MNGGGGVDSLEELDGIGMDDDRMAIHIEREVARFIGGFNLYPGGQRGGVGGPGGGVLYQYLGEPEVFLTRAEINGGSAVGDRSELFPQTAAAVTSQTQQPVAVNHPLLGTTRQPGG